ncbi:MAG: translation initiation factor IF-2 N-terminal domain-containing protein, partial [Planctomycetes bacterium]|nr:translation initiation factor IF-2 N-terminal domain-containing protein [Planctomycetota bacterium]
MKKVRVFELAKQFGKKGPELAKLLRSLGFENIKTHMTVLDDADLMIVEARLLAQGLAKVDDESDEPALRKKKLPGDDDDEDGDLPRKKELPRKKALPTKKKLQKKTLPEPTDAPAPPAAAASP